MFSDRNSRQKKFRNIQSLFIQGLQTVTNVKSSKSFQTGISDRKNLKIFKVFSDMDSRQEKLKKVKVPGDQPHTGAINKTSCLKRLWFFHVFCFSNPSLKSTLNIFKFFVSEKALNISSFHCLETLSGKTLICFYNFPHLEIVYNQIRLWNSCLLLSEILVWKDFAFFKISFLEFLFEKTLNNFRNFPVWKFA